MSELDDLRAETAELRRQKRLLEDIWARQCAERGGHDLALAIEYAGQGHRDPTAGYFRARLEHYIAQAEPVVPQSKPNLRLVGDTNADQDS